MLPLVIETTPQNGEPRKVAFVRSPVRLGRNALNDLQIDEGFVSQWHAVIDFDGQETHFRDLGSTNGTLMDGRRLDVFSNTPGEPDFARPDSVGGQFPNYRWRKYLTRLWQRRNKRYRLDYGRYLCRSFNDGKAGEDRLRRFEIWYVEERTRAHYLPPKMTRHKLWRHWCFPEDAPA